ncbi:acyltransferase family protein [Bradyrhizobium sp. I71]|uniref:acyltransferase family protein n=1 Tax=Bradyrhizobium sp. I71 TaxID=2590772 RepID=UPI001EF781AD|nr:acyltransferase family protein [Bradyrhizobium sp. I71]ULK95960.1 acyltransferase family protein [Bradyrhizobium sp. I71]
MKYVSVADRMAGQSTGWDYLHICLAIFVVFMHSFRITQGDWIADAMSNSIFRGLFNSILPVFFALSGFLVAGSLERNTLPTFLALRGLRILPALAVEITLSALIIGPLFTEFTLREYFSDPSFGLSPANSSKNG